VTTPEVKVIRYRDDDGEVFVGVSDDSGVRDLPVDSVAGLLAADLARWKDLLDQAGPVRRDPVTLLPPIDGDTEVWAAGVTYRRSRDARMEEATAHRAAETAAAAGDPYDRVYLAARPELFFKAQAWRVCGPGEPVAIRADSTVDVPEPELAVVVTATGQIAGYTLCNDLSSRSIEGENPLYLPQAKVYAGSCALGPGIVPADAVPDPGGLVVTLRVRRGGAVVFAGQTNTGQIVRPLEDLISWLFEGQDFPDGVVLSTGTGIVPDLDFTLQPGDEVTVAVDEIGELTNPVVRGKQAMTWLQQRRRVRR
jgi:2-dehydro-3-deoxy-D-arabinonate dehydratase